MSAFHLISDHLIIRPSLLHPPPTLLFLLDLFKLLFGFRGPRKVLLVGLSDAGKTICFTQLVARKFVNTVTSMKVTECPFDLNGKYRLAVDIPGFDRLRAKFWDDNKRSANALVFLVDSAAFVNNVRDVADFLYTILADPAVTGRRVPILIAANKQDQPLAKSAAVIRKQLEKELQVIRETRAADLASTNESGTAQALVGHADKEFSFQDLRNRVSFVDCSCLEQGDHNLNELRAWLKKNL